MDRTKNPSIETIGEIKLAGMEKELMPAQTPLYVINTGGEDILKIDLVFEAGTCYQSKPLVARMVNGMLTEGTGKYNRLQIAEMLDFYGVNYDLNVEKDHAYLSFIFQKKLLKEVLYLVREITTNAIFPEDEFGVLLNRKEQQFVADSLKVNTMAKRHFFKLIFGEEHPYGTFLTQDDFHHLKKEEVVAFYRDYYNSSNCKILLTGNIDKNLKQTVIDLLGSQPWNNATKPTDKISHEIKNNTGRHVIKKKGAVQSAIRIGKPVINKNHEDYPRLLLTNVLLGGYFGSRLMKNIREDKGYTYGISSLLISHLYSGYFVIHTEVGREVCFSALDEINKEIKTLISDKVKQSELDHVKNYLLGNILRMLDGPLSIAEAYRALIEYDQDENYFNQLIRSIKQAKPADINQLAEKYFQPDSMVEIIVGDH